MFPRTAKSSSVPGHQQPSRKKTKQSFGVFRSRVASFSGLFVCSFFFVAKVDVWTESVLFPFPPLSPTYCWIYQPVSRGFEISTINSAVKPFQLDGTEPKVPFLFLKKSHVPTCRRGWHAYFGHDLNSPLKKKHPIMRTGKVIFIINASKISPSNWKINNFLHPQPWLYRAMYLKTTECYLTLLSSQTAQIAQDI